MSLTVLGQSGGLSVRRVTLEKSSPEICRNHQLGGAGDQARTIIYNVTIQLSSRLGISTLCHKQKCWTFLGGVEHKSY